MKFSTNALRLSAVALLIGLAGCTSHLETPCERADGKCGFYYTDEDEAAVGKRYSPRPPQNQISEFSFEASVKLCWRQPNYPMCAFDCLENPEREPWNDWCEAEPAPADRIINPQEYTEEELLEILGE